MRRLASARTAALGVELERGVGARRQSRRRSRMTVTSQASGGSELFRDQLAFVKQHIDHALALSAGFEQTADADRAYVVAGEAFTVHVARRCRADVTCTFDSPALILPDDSKREGHGGHDIRPDGLFGDAGFETITTQRVSRQFSGARAAGRSFGDADDRWIQIRCDATGDAYRSDFDACRSSAAADGAGVHADGRAESDGRSFG